MRSILVLAYAVSPYRGSEYAVSWNYILNLSKDNRLTILYGTSGDHLGDSEELENYLKINQINNVTFVHVAPSKWTNILNALNKKNIFNYSFYWAYKSWHLQVYRELNDLVSLETIDIIHFLCPIGYREPGFLWRNKIPYVWGPIGGVNNVPLCLFKILSVKGKIKYMIRNCVNYLQLRCNISLKKCLKNVDVLLSSTTETRNKFLELYGKDSIYMPENCISGTPHLNADKFKDEKLNILFVGRLDEGKGCILLLRALSQIKTKGKIVLNIIGDGPVKHSLEQYAKDNDLTEVVRFHGKLPRAKVLSMYDTAHLHVITSLSEANTTVIWEAMEHGVPTLTLDHCGMHDLVNAECGIKIKIVSVEQIIQDIASEIESLIANPVRVQSMASATIKQSELYLWDRRKEQLNSIYDKLLATHQDS